MFAEWLCEQRIITICSRRALIEQNCYEPPSITKPTNQYWRLFQALGTLTGTLHEQELGLSFIAVTRLSSGGVTYQRGGFSAYRTDAGWICSSWSSRIVLVKQKNLSAVDFKYLQQDFPRDVLITKNAYRLYFTGTRLVSPSSPGLFMSSSPTASPEVKNKSHKQGNKSRTTCGHLGKKF